MSEMKRITEQMDSLSEFVGKQVEIEHVFYGNLQNEVGEMREISPYGNAVVGCSGIPFIGYGSAIRRITLVGASKIIYWNPFIRADYDVRSDEERYPIVAASFGEDHANRERDSKIEEDRKWKARVAELDAAAKTKAPELIEAGAVLVKPELTEEWREYARNNTNDGYSAAVIEGTVGGLKALADGKTVAEAESQCGAAETGFQMGCVAKGLAHFSPRGEEFRAYWNRKYMNEADAAKADASGGTVNPAILSIVSTPAATAKKGAEANEHPGK